MHKLIIAFALTVTTLAAPTMAGERVTVGKAVIVRGQNGNACDANSLMMGSAPQATGLNGSVQNLSVNCSPDGSLSVNELRKGLNNPHICWTKLEDLEKRNSGVIVETDPIGGNANHCLVRDITPNEMVKALNYKP